MPVKNFDAKTLEDLYDDGEVEGFELIDNDYNYSDEGKYSLAQMIFKELESGKTYRCDIMRHGSYFTDYDFTFEEGCEEVVLKEVKSQQWVKA